MDISLEKKDPKKKLERRLESIGFGEYLDLDWPVLGRRMLDTYRWLMGEVRQPEWVRG